MESFKAILSPSVSALHGPGDLSDRLDTFYNKTENRFKLIVNKTLVLYSNTKACAFFIPFRS